MISYLITVCNEHEELDTLLNQLSTSIQPDNEIVILFDSRKLTQEVYACISKWLKVFEAINIKRCVAVGGLMTDDFAAYKNFGNTHCTLPWIFQIDADERFMYPNFPEVLTETLTGLAEDVDVLYISRVNTVFGITMEHLTKWGWKFITLGDLVSECPVDEMPDGYRDLLQTANLILEENEQTVKYKVPVINFPDYQSRVYRNKEGVRWEGKVHERVVSNNRSEYFGLSSLYSLLHIKDIKRQEQQNNYYSTLIY